MNHHTISREIWRVMEEEKDVERQGQMLKKKEQQELDFKVVTGLREFTRTGVLHAVAKLIVTNNQVSH